MEGAAGVARREAWGCHVPDTDGSRPIVHQSRTSRGSLWCLCENVFKKRAENVRLREEVLIKRVRNSKGNIKVRAVGVLHGGRSTPTEGTVGFGEHTPEQVHP